MDENAADIVPIEHTPYRLDDSFRFNGAEYRRGVSIPRSTDMVVASPGVEDAYRATPPAIFVMLKRIYVTGAATDPDHLQILLKSQCLRDVPQDVISLYLHRHQEELDLERTAFLDDLYRAQIGEMLEVGASPTVERYSRLASNIGVLLDAYILNMMKGEAVFTSKELGDVTRTMLSLQSADPSFQVGATTVRKRATKKQLSTDHNKQIGVIMAKITEMADGGETQADAILEPYEARTKELLED